MTQQGLKPSWQGLKAPLANFNNPVEEMVGQFVEWKLELDNFNNNQVVFKFSQCQILKSDTPYPYPEWEMSIKFSEQEVSAWGFFGDSASEALGTTRELLDIDLMKGRWVHILRTSHDYGPDKTKEVSPGVPARIMGVVYRVVRFIQPGEAVTSIAQATPAQVQEAPVAALNPQGTTPTQQVAVPVTMPAAQVVATPAPAAVATPIVAAVPVPVETVTTVPPSPVATIEAPAVTQSAEDRALELLHGRDAASFFALAIPDEVIRPNSDLVNAIMSGVFVQTQITSGKVIKNEDGTHTVMGK